MGTSAAVVALGEQDTMFGYSFGDGHRLIHQSLAISTMGAAYGFAPCHVVHHGKMLPSRSGIRAGFMQRPTALDVG